MNNCSNCRHARQIGDTSRQDLVACSKAMDSENPLASIQQNGCTATVYYWGWAFPRRWPAQPNDGTFGSGAMVNNCIIIAADSSCSLFKPYSQND